MTNTTAAATMQLSRDVERQIARWVRERFGPTSIEFGVRRTVTGTSSANALLWEEDADLDDTRLFKAATGGTVLAVLPELPDCATLDLYVYDSRDGELLTNVYVTIKNGIVADIHDRDLEADARTQAILGRPFSK